MFKVETWLTWYFDYYFKYYEILGGHFKTGYYCFKQHLIQVTKILPVLKWFIIQTSMSYSHTVPHNIGLNTTLKRKSRHIETSLKNFRCKNNFMTLQTRFY